ncbi:RING-type E3 ubiquitin transferase [Ranunculus cassubicifolius]
MSSSNDRVLNLVSQLALATDGALAGVALAYIAIQAWCKYIHTSSALHKIQCAKSVPISDLRSLLSPTQSSESEDKLVIVRGFVEAKSVFDGNLPLLKPSILQSYSSAEKGVVWQKTQTCIYNDSRGLLAWTGDLGTILGKSWKNPKSTSLRTIPFVLVGSRQLPSLDYVVVNLDGSTHPLPLTTVYHHLQPVPTTPFTFLQAIFGHSYPVGLLDEEKLLPLGQEISAVGICNAQDGAPHIKSCKEFPFFLSDMTQDQMVEDLAHKTKILLWSGIILGSVSLGVLGYAFTKNWRRLKEWRERRQQRQLRDTEIAAMNASTEDNNAEDTEDIPDGQLCVICLMRRKRSAFVPCGHFVCCHRCALSVERDSAPKCPLCRQTIRTSVRIYDS